MATMLQDLARRLGLPRGTGDPRADAASDLFRAIDEARAAGRREDAAAFAAEALDRHGDLPVAYEKAGFLALEGGRDAEAREHFARGTEVDPAFAPNWFGLFLVADRAQDWRAAMDAALRLLDWGDVYGGRAAFLGRLRGVADALVRRGEGDGLEPVYALLREAGDDPLVRAHGVESLNRIGDYEAAEAEFRDAPEEAFDEPALRAAAAETLTRLGRPRDAAEMAEPLLDMAEPSLHALRVYLNCFDTAAGRRAAASAARLRLGNRASDPRIALLLAAKSGAHDDALDLLDAEPDPDLRREVFFDLLGMGYALLAEGRRAEARRLADILDATGTSPAHVVLLRMNLAFVDQDWAAARRLLEAVEASDPALAREMDLKRFELACFTGDMETAGALFDRLRDAPGLPAAFFPPLMRYLAESRRWAEIADLFEARHIPDFRFEQSGGVVFRAYDRLGRLPDLRAAIERVPDWAARPDLTRLRRAVLDATATDAASTAAAAADMDLAGNPVVSARLDLKAAMLGDRTRPAQGREAIYFCTNATYRRGTAATVASLLRSNLRLLREMRTIVVTDETDGLSAEVFDALGAATGCRIETVPADGFMDDFERLDASYGLFTSGTELAASAYYRIFYARQLLAEGEVTRAVYLDSDVLVRRDLSHLFTWDLDGAPLAARREAVRPEVRQAAALHGMAPEDYFNSGVLALDLSHPEAAAALDASIHAVLDEGTTLLFHDQCALNIGFKGRVGYLPERFNHFLPPDLADDPVDGAAAIVHFLDRPKPWDALYDHAAGLDWIASYEALAPLVGRRLASRLYFEV